MPEVATQFASQVNPAHAQVFNSENFDPTGVGLALSGGGYKAAAYHLGALIRLNELRYLGKINRISSVSGGSIAAGFLGRQWRHIEYDGTFAAAFWDGYVEPLSEFLTEVNLDVPQGILGLLLPFRSGADGVVKGYDKHLFKGATLQDLPTGPGVPEFALVATNYELNSLWRFSRKYAADYRVGRIDNPTFPLAEVVAASSAFPPFFCPVELEFGTAKPKPMEGANRNEGRFLKRALLADGGIYDNMGLEPIWKRYGTLLVSNAGDAVDEDAHPTDWGRLMLRIVGLMHRQAENNRQRQLMILSQLQQRKVAYWPLRNDGSNYPKPSAAQLSKADIHKAQNEGVRLWSLGRKGFEGLVNQGYSLCDSAMQSYIALEPGLPAAKLPY